MVCGLPTREDGATFDAATRVSPHTTTCAGPASRQVKKFFSAQSTEQSCRGPLVLRVATWNVRRLLENKGSIETARHHGREVAEDKKIQLVREFERLSITLAGLQETQSFGFAVYHVCAATVLMSGLPTSNLIVCVVSW